MALRILLATIEQHAARHKRYIVPCISLSIDFYIRIFLRVFTSRARCLRLAPPRPAWLARRRCACRALAQTLLRSSRPQRPR